MIGGIKAAGHPTAVSRIKTVSRLNYLQTIAVTPHVFHNLWTGKPISLSFDITTGCNLNCPYCYWQKSKRQTQLSVTEIVNLARKYRYQGIIHATWVGGEPTLRPDVLQAVTPIFPINWIVTNGIEIKHPRFPDFDIFSLPNTSIIVSIDGVGTIHDYSRQHPGLYSAIKKRFWNKPVLTTTTLHQANKDQPEKLLRAWNRSGIKGMTFEFATPIGRAADPRYDLIGKDRDTIIDRLIELKRIYGRFLVNSVQGLNMLRSENLKKWTGAAKCPTARFAVSLDEIGQRKLPCILGSAPDNPRGVKPACGSCGCHVPTVLSGIKHLDWETIQSAFWFL